MIPIPGALVEVGDVVKRQQVSKYFLIFEQLFIAVFARVFDEGGEEIAWMTL